MRAEQEWNAYRRLASAILRYAVSDMVAPDEGRGEYPRAEFSRIFPRCDGRLRQLELAEFFQSPTAELYLRVAGLRGQTGADMWRRVKDEPETRRQIESAMHELRVAATERGTWTRD
ncbi:MAG: hypothetical protein M1482_04910 [Chloroflexi bacterium]|nr:hypothetical protein [Chloroflexota bacterium]